MKRARCSFVIAWIHPGYEGGKALACSSSAKSSPDSARSRLRRLSCNCSTRRAPTIAAVTPGWANSQASATCAPLTP